MPESYNADVQKLKRMVFLYFLGIPIEPPYSEIIKAFDDFYNPYEKIQLDSIFNQSVICALDKEQNILFSMSDDMEDKYSLITYSKHHSEMVGRMRELLKDSNVDGLKTELMLANLNRIMSLRNGLDFNSHISDNSTSFYFDNLKKEYLLKKRNNKEL